MGDYIEREAALDAISEWLMKALHPENMSSYNEGERAAYRTALSEIANIPAADVPSALWTDEPISGTEFMTHNQGQSGFEIHFRTDDKAKYEAVQDECRRQIDHAKPAADVRPVTLCRDCIWGEPWYRDKSRCFLWNESGIDVFNDGFCNYGEKREES